MIKHNFSGCISAIVKAFLHFSMYLSTCTSISVTSLRTLRKQSMFRELYKLSFFDLRIWAYECFRWRDSKMLSAQTLLQVVARTTFLNQISSWNSFLSQLRLPWFVWRWSALYYARCPTLLWGFHIFISAKLYTASPAAFVGKRRCFSKLSTTQTNPFFVLNALKLPAQTSKQIVIFQKCEIFWHSTAWHCKLWWRTVQTVFICVTRGLYQRKTVFVYELLVSRLVGSARW